MAEGWDDWDLFIAAYDQLLAQAIDWLSTREQPKTYEIVIEAITRLKKNENVLTAGIGLFALVGFLHTLNIMKEQHDGDEGETPRGQVPVE